MRDMTPILANNGIAGVVGIGIIIIGITIMWLVWRKKFPAGNKRTLIVLATGIPLGIALLYIVQWILDALGYGRVQPPF